ncbi:hypothetical protein HYU19_03945 [Candidatus Woesearchaeota archaeon]|nr:hypothetical protein [Candidatus Woesearchaeota archaeon]
MTQIHDVLDKDPSRRFDDGSIEYQHAHREFLSDMEFEIYVDKLTVQCVSLFRHQALLDALRDWCKIHGYYYEVFSQKTRVTSTGKSSSFTFHFQKKFSQLHVSFLVLDLTMQDMTDITKVVDKKTIPFSKGKVTAVINGFLGTALKHRVESFPRMALIRGVIDKFIYKLDRPVYPGTVVRDGAGLAAHIRSFLSLEQKRLQGAE